MQLDIHNKELLAIILVLEDRRRYLKGSRQQTKILTDHKNLVPFMTKKKLNKGQVRWKLFLNQFDFKIVYLPGKEVGKPNALTRGPGYIPTEDDERNTQMEQILLPEHYFEKIEVMELTKLHDKDWNMIKNASLKDQKFMDIKDAFHKGVKEIKAVAKTTELITRQYYCQRMRETIKQYIKNCDTCQQSKAVHHAPYGLL